MKELIFQKKVIEAVRELGGYAVALNNRFLRSIPDLMLVYNYNTYVVEVKMAELIKTKDIYRISITEGQKLEIKKLQESGADSGVMIYTVEDKEIRVMCSRKVEETYTGDFFRFHSKVYTARKNLKSSLISLIELGMLNNFIGK